MSILQFNRGHRLSWAGATDASLREASSRHGLSRRNWSSAAGAPSPAPRC